MKIIFETNTKIKTKNDTKAWPRPRSRAQTGQWPRQRQKPWLDQHQEKDNDQYYDKTDSVPRPRLSPDQNSTHDKDQTKTQPMTKTKPKLNPWQRPNQNHDHTEITVCNDENLNNDLEKKSDNVSNNKTPPAKWEVDIDEEFGHYKLW